MKKLILGLVVAAAIATPIAIAGPASAGTPGTVDTTTYSSGTYHHVLAADYTCGIFDGHTVINFTLDNGAGATGSGVLTPDATGGGVFAFTGNTGGSYPWSYAGTYDANGVWTDADATAGVGEVYGFGTDGPITGTQFGSVVGQFTGIPTNCPAPEVPAKVTANHGQYVSGAAHAGIKGKPLAEIAKDVTLVGPYTGPAA